MRRALIGAGGLAALAGGGAWLLRRRDAAAYDRLAVETWRPPRMAPPLLRELVRCATLAPNSHNTQPWRFALAAEGLRLLPDPARRTPAVDPDDHHLFASLGCALETMLQAAPVLGLRAEAAVDGAGIATLRVSPAPARGNDLAAAIARRHSTRLPFDPAPLPAADLASLEQAGGADPAVGLVLVSAPAARATLAELIIAANRAQIRDAAFVAELLSWIRFSHAAALARRDGLFAGSMGNPAVPEAIGRRIFPLVFTEAAETRRLARLLDATPAFAVLAAAEAGPRGWVAAGRAAQRLCLRATALGLATSWVNQPVEVAAMRPALAALAGLGDRRPDFVLRLGRGPAAPPSLRRPPQDVMAEEQA
ncbi:Tat pathway signal protein [Roseomonas eburnea]|uniref:Tat pathway signal protein n=1 Tax=Neoroseomonas eburnea TaxID=1346889 RepID=A0A9X9XAK2_9PROT|nr:nitroreductase family protein [Neoroseomonas eburnea]MBR0680738.1 Tat pathway signal protein [Neoroseomonas eburnea]